MTIDLRQFHQTFFEESFEGLAAMEAELLRVERALASPPFVPDAEQLNRIFRVAHSIKGGSGTFGFPVIAEFTHLLESLLDDIRGNRRPIDAPVVALLLRAVDGARELMRTVQAGGNIDGGTLEELRTELEAAQCLGARAVPAAPAAPQPDPTASGWQIRFFPHAQFFGTGNDPARILRELEQLGRMEARADLSRLPAWDRFDPHVCYLGWELDLRDPLERAAVAEAFAWVTEESTVEIAPLKPSAPAVAGGGTKTEDGAAGSIRVATPKVDALVDMVGEFVITQTMLNLLSENFTPDCLPRLRSGLAQLERHTRELQDCVLGIRMLPIGFVFSRLPRMVRDVSQQLGKKVELRVSGERTELDKTIIERVSDPLIHLVRNSIDHGIETPAARRGAGKAETGEIRLNAYHKGGNVIIEIEDDGAGLNRERILALACERGLVAADAQLEPEQIDELIFLPGFSTASAVNGVSGRGVGLDVVRNNIRSLAGGVEVVSVPGRGTRFSIRLPLTLAIVDGMSVRVGNQTYIAPLAWIAESVRLPHTQASCPAGGPEVIALRNEYLPLLRLHQVFNIPAPVTELDKGIVVVVEADGKKAALFVDDLLGQQQVVIKSLETHCIKLEGISAATIQGDGTVALILDVAALIRRAHGALPHAPGFPGATGTHSHNAFLTAH